MGLRLRRDGLRWLFAPFFTKSLLDQKENKNFFEIQQIQPLSM